MLKILALSLSTAVLGTAWADDASAADQTADLDGGSTKAAARKQVTVREVERGLYLKTNVGVLAFVGPKGQDGLLQAGTALSLTLGQDFIDKEKSSAAWEIFFHQALNNGAKYNQGMLTANPDDRFQGDIHTFTLGGAFEYSKYLSRRLGLGVRAGGGVTFIPALMNNQYYTELVLPAWGNNPGAGLHDGPTGMILAGPTLEYYTKLSHFSIGIDASFVMYFGLDIGVDATGFLKYTF